MSDAAGGAEQLDVPQGRYALHRHPAGRTTGRRAWDAADEYALQYLADGAAAAVVAGRPTVVVNGGPGAVPIALAASGASSAAPVLAVSDSFVDHLATTANLDRNGIDRSVVALLAPIEAGWARLAEGGPVGLLVIKMPKSSALLEDELCHLAPLLDERTVVVGAGMAKHIHSSTIQLFERIVGPTTTSLARKKARLLFVRPDRSIAPAASPWPRPVPIGDGIVMVNHANVFSRERLDVGTRFLLDHLPEIDGLCRVVDLGCGNGVVGLTLARRAPAADVLFVDESFQAVEAARATVSASAGAGGSDAEREGSLRFVVGDQFEVFDDAEPPEAGTVDLVVNNPPFHDDHAIGDAVAWAMFTGSHRVLRPGGALLVVGNRHLAYHAKLKRIFGNCTVVAANSKFVVYRAGR